MRWNEEVSTVSRTDGGRRLARAVGGGWMVRRAAMMLGSGWGVGVSGSRGGWSRRHRWWRLRRAWSRQNGLG